MSSYIEIMNTFMKVAQDRQDVRLINVYKSVPITCLAKISRVYNGTIMLKVTKDQIICLQQDKETYVHCDDLPSTVLAKVDKVDFANSYTVLSNFEYANTSIENRRGDRVEPKIPTNVVVHQVARDASISTQLADISLDGLSAFLDPNYYDPRVFHSGADVMIGMRLTRPEQEFSQDFKMSGTIVNIRGETRTRNFRMGMRIFPDEDQKTVLAQYIAIRQNEITEELKSYLDLPKDKPI